MTNPSNPFTSVNIVNASAAIGNTSQKLLVIGQKTSVGTAGSGDLQENLGDDSAILNGLAGEDSMAAEMVRAVREVNKVTQVDAIFLDDNGSGVEATGLLAITGTATADGSIIVNFGSEINHRLTVAISNTDTAAAVAASIVAAMATDDALPVAGVVATDNVALTAINAGTYGNTIGLSIEGSVAGIVIAVTGMGLVVAGSVDPVLTGVFDVVGNNRYQGVAWPYPDSTSLGILTGFLDPRFNTDNAVLDGAGFVSKTEATVNTAATTLNALNSENLVMIMDKQTSEATFVGPAQLEIPAIKASQFAAIRALRLTDNASISEFVISANGPLDSFGGPALASKPYFNTPFAKLPLVGVSRGWTDTEIATIETAGGAVIGNNDAGNTVIIGQVPTTFKTDTAGNPDLTFKWLNFRDTASGAREYFFNNLKSRFAQSRLTEGDLIAGRDIANALSIRVEVEKLYQDLSGPDFVLVQAGSDAIKFFKDNLTITLDLALGKATVQMIVPIVTQLRIILVTMKITFSVEG